MHVRNLVTSERPRWPRRSGSRTRSQISHKPRPHHITTHPLASHVDAGNIRRASDPFHPVGATRSLNGGMRRRRSAEGKLSFGPGSWLCGSNTCRHMRQDGGEAQRQPAKQQLRQRKQIFQIQVAPQQLKEELQIMSWKDQNQSEV